MNKGGKSASIPPITTWQVETLRLTAFLDPNLNDQIEKTNWWNDLLDEQPEIRISRPKVGGQQEEGQFEERKLVLTTQTGRIDWRLTATEKGLGVGEISIAESFPESLAKFLKLMLDWFELETCPSVRRLAFGAILLQPVKNRREGYRQIAAYLHNVQLSPDNTSDFLYQINRPRNSSSGITDLKINRLSKWSIAASMESTFSFESTSVSHFPGMQRFACRLELDINTTPDFGGELTREQLPQIFQELVDLGKEIAQKGDIP